MTRTKANTPVQQLEHLRNEAQAALDVFTRALASLQANVRAIDDTVACNTATIERLQGCNAELRSLADKNIRIINNLGGLLDGDTETNN